MHGKQDFIKFTRCKYYAKIANYREIRDNANGGENRIHLPPKNM